jgi:hypothetical protein
LNRPGFDSQHCKIFLFTVSKPTLPPPTQSVTGVRRQGLVADDTSPSSVRVKKPGCITPVIKYREKLLLVYSNRNIYLLLVVFHSMACTRSLLFLLQDVHRVLGRPISLFLPSCTEKLVLDLQHVAVRKAGRRNSEAEAGPERQEMP